LISTLNGGSLTRYRLRFSSLYSTGTIICLLELRLEAGRRFAGSMRFSSIGPRTRAGKGLIHFPLPGASAPGVRRLESRLSEIDGRKEIFKLIRETSTDLKLLQRSDSSYMNTMGCAFNPVADTEERTNGRAIHCR